MEEIERHELKPGEVCPYCGQKKRGGYTRKPEAALASREAGKLGGRPVNPNSKRQQMLRAKAEKERAK